MSVGNDPFIVLQDVAQVLIAVAAILVVCFAIHRHGTRKPRRYMPGNLGSALQELQKMLRPSIEHQLQEQRRVDVNEDDEGGPDDPGRYYRRIREKVDKANGEKRESKTS